MQPQVSIQQQRFVTATTTAYDNIAATDEEQEDAGEIIVYKFDINPGKAISVMMIICGIIAVCVGSISLALGLGKIEYSGGHFYASALMVNITNDKCLWFYDNKYLFKEYVGRRLAVLSGGKRESIFF